VKVISEGDAAFPHEPNRFPSFNLLPRFYQDLGKVAVEVIHRLAFIILVKLHNDQIAVKIGSGAVSDLAIVPGGDNFSIACGQDPCIWISGHINPVVDEILPSSGRPVGVQ
jgi:hypothetical protein